MPPTGLQPQRIRSEVSLLGSKSVHPSPARCLGLKPTCSFSHRNPKSRRGQGHTPCKPLGEEPPLSAPASGGSWACSQPLPPPQVAFSLCVVCLFLFCLL